jgi:hypothetical protein
MKARSVFVVICLVGVSLGLGTNAGAVFHLMKVREVHAGSLLDANADFIELQMYQFGQTQVSGHKLTVYGATGAATECVIPQHVANGNNQATILFATTQAQSAYGLADFTIPPLLSGGGGAVCFENIDCVSWGSFSGTTTSPAGTPEPGGIPAGQSLDRRTDISGGAGTLEAQDDTDNSSNDFEPENESATANGIVNLGSANCGPVGGDTDKPRSEIERPEHRSTGPSPNKISGSAEDVGSSKLAEVEVALRQKVKRGCKWWDGDSFARGACGTQVFLEAKGTKNWNYKISGQLKPSNTKRIKKYTAYSRATDKAGNVETAFEAGRNVSKFEVT